jgi:hypothetical protein
MASHKARVREGLFMYTSGDGYLQRFTLIKHFTDEDFVRDWRVFLVYSHIVRILCREGVIAVSVQ